MAFDSEDLLNSILAVMVDGGALNAKIAAIEAEKAAKSPSQALTPTLAAIATTSYYAQTWSNKMLNSSPSIFYGIEDVSVVENAGAVAKTYKVFVEVVLVDSGNTNDAWKRIARYSRAIEELFKGMFADSVGRSAVKVEQVRPVAFKLALDSDEEIKIGGVSVSVSLF